MKTNLCGDSTKPVRPFSLDPLVRPLLADVLRLLLLLRHEPRVCSMLTLFGFVIAILLVGGRTVDGHGAWHLVHQTAALLCWLRYRSNPRKS
jgi:hypothetical protein